MRKLIHNVEVLSSNEVEMIHKATLKILEQIGIKVPNDECLDMCQKYGAKVDKASSTVKIPAGLMEEILDKVRREKLLEEKENEGLKGEISTQIYMIDYETKTRRYGVLDDVMKGIALVEHLNNIKQANAVVIPHDVPSNMTDVESYRLIFSYSTKPGRTYILSAVSAKYIAEMAKVMGRKETYLLETVSPLQFRKESLETALVFVKSGQMVKMGPMVIAGATGPMTLAGTLTLQNAECLASLFLIHVLTGQFGAYCAGGHSIDLKTMLCSFGSPNQALLGIATAQMGRFYGMKVRTNSGLTDALMPDFQAGFEKGVNAVFSCLAGTVDVGCQGIVGADQGFSMEQLVLDNEWLDFYNFIHKGIEVTEDAIGLDVIEQVGIGGNFISEEHTVKYMKDNYWKPVTFNRECWDYWIAEGSKSILDKAHEVVQSAVAGYKSIEPVIGQSKFEEINYIAKAAREELARVD